MSSKVSYQTGSLNDWLRVNDYDGFHRTLSSEGPQSAKETFAETEAKRHVQYLALLAQLHSRPLEFVGLEATKRASNQPHEYILCLWTGIQLVGTAQASLLLPAGIPTVHISNVVVEETYRGKGLGEFIMIMLRRRCRLRWQNDYGKLIYQLTSQQSRGTQGFYEQLGYTGTPTVRYSR
jgi:ribosomal protein S18 acetylase RimI-like enzyme